MYKTINELDFIDEFRKAGRLEDGEGNGAGFTIAGCRALFDHLTDLEQGFSSSDEFPNGHPGLELSVPDLCCTYAEHGSALEAWLQHGSQEDYDAFDADDDEQRALCALDWFNDQTTVIEVPGTYRVILGIF